MSRGMNVCTLDYFVSEVELKDGKKGPWAVVKGYYEAQSRDGETLQVQIRCTAFGVVAARIAKCEDKTVTARFELGAWKNDKGYVNPEYVCVSVSVPWPDSQQPRQGDIGTSGMKRGAPPPREVQDDLDLPF